MELKKRLFILRLSCSGEEPLLYDIVEGNIIV